MLLAPKNDFGLNESFQAILHENILPTVEDSSVVRKDGAGEVNRWLVHSKTT